MVRADPPSRTRSLSPGSRQEICNFFAAGTCKRGKDCAFKHVKPPLMSRRKRRRIKRNNNEAGQAVEDQNSSKGSQSQRSPRGGKPASSSNSAAACLLKAVVMVAALRPSTSLPCRSEGLALPSPILDNQHQKHDFQKLSFNDNPEIYMSMRLTASLVLHHCGSLQSLRER